MNNRIRIAGKFVAYNLEAFIWIAAILYFAVSPVYSSGHFTICPLSLAGFEHCPGCGLGRSLVLLLHGYFAESFRMHPLASFAMLLFIARIVIVFRNYTQFQKRITSIG